MRIGRDEGNRVVEILLPRFLLEHFPILLLLGGMRLENPDAD